MQLQDAEDDSDAELTNPPLLLYDPIMNPNRTSPFALLLSGLILTAYTAVAQPSNQQASPALEAEVRTAIDQLLSKVVQPARSSKPLRVVVLDFPARTKMAPGMSHFSERLHKMAEDVLRNDQRVEVVSQQEYVVWRESEAMDFQVRGRGPQANEPVHAELSGSYEWSGDQV